MQEKDILYQSCRWHLDSLPVSVVLGHSASTFKRRLAKFYLHGFVHYSQLLLLFYLVCCSLICVYFMTVSVVVFTLLSIKLSWAEFFNIDLWQLVTFAVTACSELKKFCLAVVPMCHWFERFHSISSESAAICQCKRLTGFDAYLAIW